MSEQPVPMTHFGVFSRAEQRVLQTIFKAIAARRAGPIKSHGPIRIIGSH
jgi:hypothetical protein